LSSLEVKFGDKRKHLKPLFEDKDRHQVIVAHRRFGKTSYALWKAIIGAIAIPGSRYFVILPTYKQAKMIALDMLKSFTRELGVVEKINDSDLLAEFFNGSKIELKGSDYPDSLRGVGLTGAIFDEYSMQDPSIFTEIIRPALSDTPGSWSVKISTPKGKNHFYDDWIKSNCRWNFKASDTGVIPKEELEELSRDMSIDEYNQEYENAFLYFAGQIYTEFKPEVHIIDPKEVKGRDRISIDHGMRNPTAVGFYTIDYDGNVYKTDEIYKEGVEIGDMSGRIKRIWRNKDEQPTGVIDPSTAAKDRFKDGIPYSIYQEFCDNGLSLRLAPNSVIAGINLVKQFLSDKRLFIFRRCEKTIWEMENYRWKDRKGADANLPEEPIKVRDHAVDELRYLIASQFGAAEKPKEPIKRFSEEYFEKLSEVNMGRKQPSWA